MAVEEKTQPNGAPAPQGNGHANGNEGSKYAPPKEEGKGAPKEDKKPDDDQKKPPSPIKKLIIGTAVAAVLIVGLIWGLSIYHYGQNHESTDDAYVAGNLINVSPIISGTLSKLLVDEGDKIKKNTVIARLEDSGPLALLAQSQAAYLAAESQLPQAQSSLQYQQQATDASIRKAQAELASQEAKTAGALQQVTLSRNTTINQVKQAQSQIVQAQAQAAQSEAQVQTALAALSAQQQAVQTAQRAADAATANIGIARANTIRFQRDETRYAKLVQQEAVTPQQYDAARAAADSAQSQLDTSTYQAAQAKSQVTQTRAGVAQARFQVEAARRAAAAAHKQVDVTRAGLGIAEANGTQVGIQQANVANNQGQNAGALADLATAQAGRTNIQLRENQILTARAGVLQAKAALQNAQVTENDTFIYAPSDGTVVKKAANVGDALSPGQAILTVTQGDYVYVTANYKETQLRFVKPNQPAEVQVDSFPGLIFKGHVKSINETTGATQALLPPDNATGNFTKVVQRIPVRIELDAAKDDEDKKYARSAEILALRQGMSVNATVDVSSARK